MESYFVFCAARECVVFICAPTRSPAAAPLPAPNQLIGARFASSGQSAAVYSLRPHPTSERGAAHPNRYGYAGSSRADDGDNDEEQEDEDHEEEEEEDEEETDDDHGGSANQRWRSTESRLHAIDPIDDRSAKRAGLRQRVPSKRHDDEDDDDDDDDNVPARGGRLASGAKTGRGRNNPVRRGGSGEYLPSYAGLDHSDPMSSAVAAMAAVAAASGSTGGSRARKRKVGKGGDSDDDGCVLLAT